MQCAPSLHNLMHRKGASGGIKNKGKASYKVKKPACSKAEPARPKAEPARKAEPVRKALPARRAEPARPRSPPLAGNTERAASSAEVSPLAAMLASVQVLNGFPRAAYPTFVKQVGQKSYTISGPGGVGRVEVQVRNRLFRVMAVRPGKTLPARRNFPWASDIPLAWKATCDCL